MIDTISKSVGDCKDPSGSLTGTVRQKEEVEERVPGAQHRPGSRSRMEGQRQSPSGRSVPGALLEAVQGLPGSFPRASAEQTRSAGNVAAAIGPMNYLAAPLLPY